MSKKVMNGIVVILVVIMGCLINIDVHNNKNTQQIHNQYTTVIKQKSNVQNKYNDKYTRLTNQIFKDRAKSANPIIKANATNSNDMSKVNTPINKFFSIYYSYNNEKEFKARNGQVTGLINPKILASSVFASDNGSVSDLGLHSQFDSVHNTITNFGSNNLTVISDVTYTAWSNGSSHTKGEKWFKISYDTKDNLINNITPIYRNNNAKQNQI